MAKKLPAVIIGGLLGLILGVIAGGFVGLVIGGTFLGWLEFARFPGLTGYELAAYAGALAGIVILTPVGVFLALRVTGRR